MGLDPQPDKSDAKSDLPYAGPSYVREKVIRAGPLHNNPAYSMPKDTQQSMLAIYEKRSKATPASQDHHKDLEWKSILGKFGAGSTRLTFCDDAMRHSRKVPSPSKYDYDMEQWGKFDENDRF